MSAKTLAVIEQIKERFGKAMENKESIPYNYITQYNITIDGKIVKTIVLNLKEYKFLEEPTKNDLEITLDDQYVIGVFSGQILLADLKKDNKIEVKGDESIIKALDDRAKSRAAAAAAGNN